MTGYDVHRSDRHLLVRWTQTPTRASVESLLRDITAARRAAGAPLAMLVVIPTAETDVPEPDARKALQDNARAVLDQCASLDLVIVGDDLRASLMRTAVRAMAVVTRTADRVGVHGAADQDKLRSRLPITIANALGAAIARRPDGPTAPRT